VLQRQHQSVAAAAPAVVTHHRVPIDVVHRAGGARLVGGNAHRVSYLPRELIKRSESGSPATIARRFARYNVRPTNGPPNGDPDGPSSPGSRADVGRPMSPGVRMLIDSILNARGRHRPVAQSRPRDSRCCHNLTEHGRTAEAAVSTRRRRGAVRRTRRSLRSPCR
jgi:hypothetical protein